MTKIGSLRFDIDLDQNKSDCYEISLLDLMKQTNNKPVTSNDRDEREELNNYVKQLEKKYGPVAVVKGKKIRVNDFLIQGTGYDADDPFIDDSGAEEAVVVAPELMTQYGGFFINNNDSLKLNESSFVIERVEGENDSTLSSKQPFQHKTSKLSKSQQLICQARKRLNTSKKSMSSSSSNHKLDEIINDVVTVNIKKDNGSKTIDQEAAKLAPVVAAGPGSAGAGSTDSGVSINGGNNNNNNTNRSPDKEQLVNAIIPPVTTGNPPHQQVQLPPNLPNTIVDKIRLIIDMSNKYKSEGTKLSIPFNNLLMELDVILTDKSVSKPIRSQVLRHISGTIDMKYDAILRRIYKVKETKKKTDQNSRLKPFHDAVSLALPASLVKYENDMKSYMARLEMQKQQGAPKPDIINIDLTGPNSVEPGLKPVKSTIKLNHPKRTFKWNPECKTLFLIIVTEELDSIRLCKQSKNPEEHLTKFFTDHLLSFWPPKWMSTLQLLKVSSSVIGEFKTCLASGREFKANFPIVKQKAVNKMNPNQNNGPAKINTKTLMKELVVNNVPQKQTDQKVLKVSPTVDVINVKKDSSINHYQPQVVLQQHQIVHPNQPTKALVSPGNSHCDKNNTEQTQKAYINADNKLSIPDMSPKPPKIVETNRPKSSTHMVANQIQSDKLRKSSSFVVNNQQPLKTLTPVFLSKETLKRPIMDTIQIGPPIKTSVMHTTLLDKPQNSSQTTMTPMGKKEDSLPYMYNHIYANHVQRSPVTPSDHPQHQQLRINQHPNLPISHSNNSNVNHFTHSTPYPHHMVNNVSPDHLHKNSIHQSSMQSVILNSAMEARQNIPQHITAIGNHPKQNLISNNHLNIQQTQNLQRHYMGLQSDFDSPNKSHFLPHNNHLQTIDLIDSPISMNAHQISSEMFYNFNTAHHNNNNNQRRFQN